MQIATRTHAPAARRAPGPVRSSRVLAVPEEAPVRAPGACACGGGCPRCRGETLQRKAKIGAPGDRLEREADAIADQVMQSNAVSTIHAAPASVQRSCAACEEAEEEKKRVLQRAPAASAATHAAPDAGASSRDVGVSATNRAADLASHGGVPLPPSTRALFEPRFGRDFGDVRVHADAAAADAARGVQARAYAMGSHIVFDAGEYSPTTASGQRLLAHELAHVVQQSGGAAPEIRRALKVDTKASDDPATAVSMMQPLVTALCPDFEIHPTSGRVSAKSGTDCSGFKFGAVAAGAQKVGCCCLCSMVWAPDQWTIAVTSKDSPSTQSSKREVRMTPTSGPNSPELRYWSGGATPSVQSQPPAETLGHELCGHAALMQIKAHTPLDPSTPDRAFSDEHDPTVRVENALAGEMGLPGLRRGLAASGTHRGESLRVFKVGPYPADSDDPAPFKAQIDAAIRFLDGTPDLLVDSVGFRDGSDTRADIGQTRADKVRSIVEAGIASRTADILTSAAGPETLTRVQPAVDGGPGSARIVELPMAIRPAGLRTPIGVAPPATPVHVDAEFPQVVSTLRKGGKNINACHALLSNTAWP